MDGTFQNPSVPSCRLSTMELNIHELGMQPDVCPEGASGKPDIREFFRDKTLFITGATGFVGKILIEKLLRSCPEVGPMYLMMRPKRGLEPEQRLTQIIANRVFDKLREERGEAEIQKRLRVVEGDISLPGLGLSKANRDEICQKVEIVFHVAATVRFDEPLRVAILMNVRGVRDMLALCKEIVNLKALVHTSTFFSSCQRKDIEEILYPCNADPEQMIQCAEFMENSWMDAMAPILLEGRPNTYVYTKYLAEKLVYDASKTLPIAIFRPSIVMSTLKEPEPGWMENLNGPAGIVAAGGTCTLGYFQCHAEKIAEVAPVDLCVNLMITLAWYIANFRPTECEFFNYTASKGGPNWDVFGRNFNIIYDKYPFSNAVGTPFFHLTHKKWKMHLSQYYLLAWSYIMDALRGLAGQKKTLVRMQKRVTEACWRLEHFTTNEWETTNNNVYRVFGLLNAKDAVTFNFDLRNIDWEDYVYQYTLGVRRYILKDPDSSAEKARARLWRMRWITRIVVCFVLLLLYKFIFSPLFHVMSSRDVPEVLTG